MIARTAKRFGLNYLWGLFMFTAGVIGGAGMVGVVTGMLGGHACNIP